MELNRKYLSLIIIGLSLSFQNIIAQDYQYIDTSCVKKKLFPAKNYYFNSDVIEVKLDSFGNKLNNLELKMKSNHILSNSESIFLLRLLNTISFSSIAESNKMISLFPKIESIKVMFEKAYFSWILCYYSCFWGQGNGVYIQELEINYRGKLSGSSRFKMGNFPNYKIVYR